METRRRDRPVDPATAARFDAAAADARASRAARNATAADRSSESSDAVAALIRARWQKQTRRDHYGIAAAVAVVVVDVAVAVVVEN